MMVHLAMSDLPAWSDAALRTFAYVHLAPNMAMMARTYADSIDGLLPAEPVRSSSVNRAASIRRGLPPASTMLWIQVRTLPYRIRGDAAKTQDCCGRLGRGPKEAYADRVLEHSGALCARHKIEDFWRAM